MRKDDNNWDKGAVNGIKKRERNPLKNAWNKVELINFKCTFYIIAMFCFLFS